MSFRKMLKVSLLMLLAMALAATTAHARFDLFGKLRTSQNQPNPNSAEGVLQLLVKGKGKSNVDVESGAIPYTECIKTCDTCFCTQMWPPEINMCICGDNSKSKKPAAAVQQVESSGSKVKSETIPYSECIANCTGICACTLIYPPELSTCICPDLLESTTAKAAEKLHKKLDLVSKPAAISEEGWLPYPECIEKCDECVVCTRIYPIELAYCYCGKNTTSNSKKPTIQNLEKLHKKLDLVSKPVAILKEGWLPYPECIEKCDECVVCTRIYPIELAYCYCGKNTTSNIKKLAIQNSEVVEESHKKLDLVSKTVAISAEGFLPYPECIEQCDECVVCTLIYPIEKALCYCGKKTTSNFQKWPIKNLGDDIKVILWTKASSKAAGRALPI
ncbi:hypothetical protein M0R45_028669 [Rubus argutus]|uniref:Uncharacterized protein n=1 Tax=Rubus argutus TaxID=59490 RepID=A0AAW1W6A4_RUBAR